MARKKNNRVSNAQTEQVINNVTAFEVLQQAHKDGKCRIAAVPSGTYVYKVKDSISDLRKYAVAINGNAEGIWDSTNSRYVISKEAWDAAKKGFVRVDAVAASSNAPIEVSEEPFRCFERIVSYEPVQEVSKTFVMLTFDEYAADENVEPELQKMGFEYVRSVSSYDTGDVFISTNIALWKACEQRWNEERKSKQQQPAIDMSAYATTAFVTAQINSVRDDMDKKHNEIMDAIRALSNGNKQTAAQNNATNRQPAQSNTRRGRSLSNVSTK